MDRSAKRHSPFSYLMLTGAMVAICGGISWAMPWTTATLPPAQAAETVPIHPLTLDEQSQAVDGGSPPELRPPASPPAMGGNGIPATVLDAYQRAAARAGALEPGCHLPWQLLAAIGKVESGHAEGGAVDSAGTAVRPILGPALDGTHGTAAITGPGGWARALGPMQFLPSTWATWGVDVLGTGTPDPENVYDATAAAADYLCANGRDLSTSDGTRQAVLSYNHSEQYLSVVLDWYQVYSGGAVAVPDRPAAPAPPTGAPGQSMTTQPPTTGTSTPPKPTPAPTPDPITGLGTLVTGALNGLAGLLPH